jgi:hypothetical protein
MPDVQKVTIQIEGPSKFSPGRVSFGYYVVKDGVVTMTDSAGKPVHGRRGELYNHKLEPVEDARAIAVMLTRELRRNLRGDSDMSRELVYPNCGLA